MTLRKLSKKVKCSQKAVWFFLKLSENVEDDLKKHYDPSKN